jgi:hypothetical protein
MQNQNIPPQKRSTTPKQFNKMSMLSSLLLGCSLSLALMAAPQATAQVKVVINFDHKGFSPLDDVSTQYSSSGVVFRGFTDASALVYPEVADATVYPDINPQTTPFALGTFYGHNKSQRAHILEIQFPAAAGTVSGISFKYNGAGFQGSNATFNVYNTSSNLVYSFKVAEARDSNWHLVTVPTQNVGKIAVVAPQSGWVVYLDDLEYTLTPAAPPVALNFALSGLVQNPIPAPSTTGVVKATSTPIKITTPSLLRLATNAHAITYPSGALLCAVGQFPDHVGVVVMDKAKTQILDDLTEMFSITRSGYQVIKGQWTVDLGSSDRLSGTETDLERLYFYFNDGDGTQLDVSGLGSVISKLGALDSGGNQKVTKSFTLSGAGDGAAINTKDSGNSDTAVWSGKISGSGTFSKSNN